jgi:hypothetical protein
MGTTAYTALYPTIRALVGDVGLVVQWSNDQLVLALDAGLLSEEDFDGDGTNVTPEVTAKADKLRICLRTAIVLLSPGSREGGYRTPVLSVTRGHDRPLDELQAALRTLVEGGDITAGAFTEWDKLGDAPQDYVDAVQTLASKWSGVV